MIQKSFCKKIIYIFILVFAVMPTSFGCSKPTESTEVSAQKALENPAPAPTPYNSEDFIEESSLTSDGEDPIAAASEYTPGKNYDSKLSVPTYVTNIDDTWFIVDCYHNRVIYSDSLETPLNEWNIMTSDATRPHTIASDGEVYMVDDTENKRILAYIKHTEDDGEIWFERIQEFVDMGERPHYVLYDETDGCFYAWSSMSGQMWVFKRSKDDKKVFLDASYSIPDLNGVYVRSFYEKDKQLGCCYVCN